MATKHPAAPSDRTRATRMTDFFCFQCGHLIPGDARYCTNCGATVAAPTTRIRPDLGNLGPGLTTEPATPYLERAEDVLPGDVAASAERLPPQSALLLVTHGPIAGESFIVRSDLTTIGRHPSSDIPLDDVSVSRRHAEMYRHGNDFTVRDVGSLNGTYVNRERVEEIQLRAGDDLRIGTFRMLFLQPPIRPPESADAG